MALNLNKVVIAGRMCADPELKSTQSGLSVCSFRVAVNRRVSQGEHPEADFINVIAWRTTAEFVAKYFRKGSAICVCGSLQVRSWEDRDRNKRQAVEIVASECLFVENKAAENPIPYQPTATSVYQAANASQGVNPYTAAPVGQPQAAPNFEQIGYDDDLPF